MELKQAIAQLLEHEVESVMMARANAEYAFKVVAPPRPPSEPVSPNKPLLIIVGTLLGAMLGGIPAFWRWVVAHLGLCCESHSLPSKKEGAP